MKNPEQLALVAEKAMNKAAEATTKANAVAKRLRKLREKARKAKDKAQKALAKVPSQPPEVTPPPVSPDADMNVNPNPPAVDPAPNLKVEGAGDGERAVQTEPDPAMAAGHA